MKIKCGNVEKSVGSEVEKNRGLNPAIIGLRVYKGFHVFPHFNAKTCKILRKNAILLEGRKSGIFAATR